MRILHTMLRVGDLDKSIAFYTEVLGMSLLRQKEYPKGEFTLAFLGYGPESENPALELTYNGVKIVMKWAQVLAILPLMSKMSTKPLRWRNQKVHRSYAKQGQ